MEEIVKVISVDTKKSEKSLKDLKKEVKDLKKEMEDLAVGSNEWASKVEELSTVQDELNASMLAAKGYGTNLAAVYDSTAQIVSGLAAGMSAVNAVTVIFGSENEDLQKTMVKLQAAMALVQGVQGLRGMGAGIERAAKAFRAMAVSMGTATAGTKGLQLAMVGLKAAIVQTGIGALVVLLGVMVDKLTQLMKSAKGLDRIGAELNIAADEFKKIADYRSEVLEGLEIKRDRELAAGLKSELEIWKEYQQEVMKIALDVEKSFPKVSEEYWNSMAELFQKNKKIQKDFVKSGEDNWVLYTKRTKVAMDESTNYHNYVLSLLSDEEKEKFEQLNQQYKDLIDERAGWWEKSKEISNQIKMMEINNAREQREKILEENKELLKELQQMREDNRMMLLSDQDAEDLELINSINRQLEIIQKAYDRKLITKEKYDEYILFANDAHKVKMWKITKERVDGELEIELEGLQARRDALNEFYANREAALEAEYNKPYETFKMGGYYQSTEDRKKEFEETVAYANKLLEYRGQMYEKDNALIEEQKGIALKQKDSDLKILQEQMNSKLITEEDYNNQRLEIEKAYNTAVEELAIQKEANDIALKNAEIERDNTVTEQKKKNIETINSAMMSTYSVASSLTGALANVYKQESQNAKNSEKEQKKAFQTYKALAITQAIIDTISSAQGAYSSMIGIPYVGPVLAPIAAAAAVVAGIANVKAIQNEQLASQSAAGGATASATPPAALETAPISYTRNLLGNKETDQINQPIKCYVVESDITETQNRVRVVEDNASF